MLARAANPHLLELRAFKHEVLGPFVLSEAAHAEACRASISHDGSLPHPDALAMDGEAAAAAQDGDDWNLAGGPAAAGGGRSDAAAKSKL